MASPVITVENLGKKYLIRHQQQRERYTALRDVLGRKAAVPFQWLRHRLSRPSIAAMGDSKSSIAPRFNPLSSREEFWALRDVSFDVNHGEVLGIIGRNGAGKSTLLKILSRITEPSTGRARIQGRVASLLEVGTGFHPELTGRENIFLNGAILGMAREEIRRKFDEMVAFAEVEKFLDTPVKRYSSGMYVRLAFAVAAHLEPEILVIDEVLAVGDVEFQKKCLGKMGEVAAKDGRTVLFVSHNMGAVLNLCRKGIVLESGRIAFSGDARGAVDFYNHRTAHHNGEHPAAPHLLFSIRPEESAGKDFFIKRIELLDVDGKPKPGVSTWETIRVRVAFVATKPIRKGSVVLQFAALDGSPLMLLSTQPDGTLPLSIRAGEQSVDCLLERFPLAAGEYVIGAGLAVPNVEWLCWTPELARLTVHPQDVYGSGLAPHAPRSMIAVSHKWQLCE
jgi:lipopolysaccharide transport system ATP-binding protein